LNGGSFQDFITGSNREKRFYLTAQFGIRLRQERGALTRSSFAGRMV
jgi:hypothetical protein